MRLLSLLVGLCIPVLLAIDSPAEAACSGSGLVWTCTAGSTIGDVQSAVNNASDGATVTFSSGSYSWASGSITLSNSKGVTLICQTVQSCTVSQGSDSVIYMDTLSGNNTKLYRISGFTFQNGDGCTCIWFYGSGTLNKLRIDHNRFQNYRGDAALVLLGETTTPGKFYALIDHNTVVNSSSVMLAKILGAENMNNWPSSLRGTASNVFLEDNTITITTQTNTGLGCVDVWSAGQMVFRNNTIQNCRIVAHGVAHGGVANFEVYRNTITQTAGGFSNCYRSIHHQGSGEMFVWGNTLNCSSSISGGAIEFLHYRSGTPGEAGYSDGSVAPAGQCNGSRVGDGNTSASATHRGYPCWMQPGRAPAGGSPAWGKLSPVAVYRNTYNGTKVDTNFDCPWSGGGYCAQHIQANRDYYNAVSVSAQTAPTSPFNGTVGIGHGTLANRPATCTHVTAPDGDNGGGVMYWATDQGSWNSSGGGEQGVLYRCSTTNVWTAHYTPYTYPHPLVNGGGGTGGGGGSLTPPPAPINLTVQ